MSSTLADRLPEYDASHLADAIRRRELSSVEVVEAHFERIERLNAKYNALVTLDRARGLQRAREADTELAQGRTWGPLHGVPVTVKDALETEGLRTTVGHAGYKDRVPKQDAWAVKKLKSAGAIVIGKSNCAKLCNDIQTTNDVFGTTNNPWGIDRTSGGSSGGEAAAVALGLSPLGIGSDTAGSIRVPASYCGVFGLKTSAGKIPRDGLLPLHDANHARPDSLTVIGPIARSMRDLTLCYEVLTGETAPPDTRATGPKIFWTHQFGKQPIDDEVSAALEGKLAALTGAGADITKVAPPFSLEKLFGAYIRLVLFEFTPEQIAGWFLPVFELSESLRSLFRGGARASYERLKQEQSVLTSRMDEFLRGCDCWVLPATPSSAFPHQKSGRRIPLTLEGRTARRGYWEASAGLTYPFNLLGNPSAVIPVGRDKQGLPLAVQVVGRVGEDRKLLSAAAYVATKIGAADSSAATGGQHG